MDSVTFHSGLIHDIPPQVTNKDSSGASEKWSSVSAHGVPRVVGCHSFRAKLFWSVTTVSAVVAMISLSWQVYGQFYAGATTTTITFTVREPHFPDVKICNRVWFDPDKLAADSASNDSLVHLLQKYAAGENVSDEYSRQLFLYDGNFFFSSYSMDFALRYAFNIDDYTILCRKHNRPPRRCSQVFQPVHVMETGLCYHLDAEYARVPNVGRFASIDILFHFPAHKHFRQITPMIGALVLIGADDNFMKDDAVPVNPGEMVEVEVERQTWKQSESFKTLPCVTEQWMEYRYNGSRYRRPYTMYTCEQHCVNEVFAEMHGCFAFPGFLANDSCMDLPDIRRQSIAFFSGHTRPDPKLRKKMHDCAEACYKPCNEHFFQKRVSVSRPFPNRDYLLKALREVETSDSLHRLLNETPGDTLEDKIDQISGQVAQVSVYLKYDRYEKIIELVPMHTFTSFLSNIGGSMGLWMGISVISLIELCECFVSTVYIAFFRRANRNQHNKDNPITDFYLNDRIFSTPKDCQTQTHNGITI